MNTTDKSGLYEAIMKARQALRGKIYKSGSNSAQKYNYVGHEQVLELTRELMLDNGLLLFQDKTEYVCDTPSHDGTKRITVWRGHFTLMHLPTGECRSFTYEGTTVPNDKQAYVASTSIERTVLLRLFLLAGSGDKEARETPFVEDPESDHSGTDATVKASNDTFLLEATRALDKCVTQGELEEWFISYDGWNPPKEVKDKAREAYSKHCEKLGLKPGIVAQAARSRS